MSVSITVELPDDVKAALERAARERGRSEAEVVREAIERDVSASVEHPPLPRGGFLSIEPFADRVDEILAEGFGQD